MNKMIHRAVFSIMIISTVISIFPTVAVAAPSKKTVTNAYKKYIMSHSIVKSKQVDIDGNGIKELLYLRADRFEVGVCSYNAKKKKVVKIKSIKFGKASPSVFYNKKKKSFFLMHADTCGSESYLVRLKGIKKKKVTKYASNNGKFPPAWTKINGKDVDKDEFWRQVNACLEWKKVNFRSYYDEQWQAREQ